MRHPLCDILLISCFLSWAAPLWADEYEQFEEAKPLAPQIEARSAETQEDTMDQDLAGRLRYRGYIEASSVRWTTQSGKHEDFFPLFYGSIAGHWLLTREGDLRLFGDFMGRSQQEVRPYHYALVHQLGLRMAFHDHWQWVIGKERNRRAPGLIVSPSDILHSPAAAPGLKEARQGIWLSRLSYQRSAFTFDFFYLPFLAERDNGLPPNQEQSEGLAARVYARQDGLEFSAEAGRMDERMRMGAFIQGMIRKVTKFYIEWGREEDTVILGLEKSRSDKSLLGLSYEGLADQLFRIEVLYQPDYLTAQEQQDAKRRMAGKPGRTSESIEGSALFGKKYGIVSWSGLQLFHDWDLFLTYIKNLDDDESRTLVRLNWHPLASWTMGATYSYFASELNASEALVPYQDRLDIDLRWSF